MHCMESYPTAIIVSRLPLIQRKARLMLPDFWGLTYPCHQFLPFTALIWSSVIIFLHGVRQLLILEVVGLLSHARLNSCDDVSQPCSRAITLLLMMWSQRVCLVFRHIVTVFCAAFASPDIFFRNMSQVSQHHRCFDSRGNFDGRFVDGTRAFIPVQSIVVSSASTHLWRWQIFLLAIRGIQACSSNVVVLPRPSIVSVFIL
jgi:hypothetical protein